MPTVSTQTTVNLTTGQRLVISGNGTVDFVTGFKGFDGSSVFIKSQKEFGPVESLGGTVILKPVSSLTYTLELSNKQVEYDPDLGSVVALPDLSPVSEGGIPGAAAVGRHLTFDGGEIPDPRLAAVVRFGAIDTSGTSDYLTRLDGRRIVACFAAGASNSGLTESTGGQTLTTFSSAAAAGLRWSESVTQPQTITAQASSSAAIIDIREA